MKSNLQVRRSILICILLVGIGMYLLIKPAQLSLTSEKEEWKSTLQKGETLIDGVREGGYAYLITSREGRTDYGDLLVVLESEDNIWKRIYDNDFAELHPWKIEVADVDGDGTKDLVTAVTKTAHYDKTMKNRLFVFDYLNGILVKKWVGSKFDGTWKDFTTGDLLPIPGEELIFTEQVGDDKNKLSIYYWFDFGFIKLAESEDYKEIISLSIIDKNRIQITYDKSHKYKAQLSVKDGKIIQVKEGS